MKTSGKDNHQQDRRRRQKEIQQGLAGTLRRFFGSFGLIAALISIVGIGVLISTGLGTSLLYLALIVTIASAVIEFVSGIIGVTSWNKQEKAKRCKILGILMIVTTVCGTILSIVGGQEFGSIALNTILGLVLPVLYLIGAMQLEKLQ